MPGHRNDVCIAVMKHTLAPFQKMSLTMGYPDTVVQFFRNETADILIPFSSPEVFTVNQSWFRAHLPRM
jgi:hypothetical protein